MTPTEQKLEETAEACKDLRRLADKTNTLYVDLRAAMSDIDYQASRMNPLDDPAISADQAAVRARLDDIRAKLNSAEIGSFLLTLVQEGGFIDRAWRALP